MSHSHSTGTLVTPQRVRTCERVRLFEPDSAVGFRITGYTSGTGAAYNLWVANKNQEAMLNCITCVNPSHSTANRYVVPANFFTEAAFTNQAGAEAAALAAFRGINLSAPAIGDGARIALLTVGVVQFEVEASTFIAGDMLTFSYDATAAAINPFKLKKTTNSAVAIAKVYATWPTLPKTGNQTTVLAQFDIA